MGQVVIRLLVLSVGVDPFLRHCCACLGLKMLILELGINTHNMWNCFAVN